MRKSSWMLMVLAVSLGSGTVVFARGGGGGGGMGGGSGMMGGGQNMSSQGAQAPSGARQEQEKIREENRVRIQQEGDATQARQQTRDQVQIRQEQ